MMAPAAPPPIRVVVNDRALPVATVEERGRVLVPMRAIFEALGARVDYHSTTQTIDARTNDHRARLRIGARDATVDGRSVTLDVPARVVANRTYLPLRFIGTALGATVGYDSPTRIVSVSALPSMGSSAPQAPTVTFYERPTPTPPQHPEPPGTDNPLYLQQRVELSVNGSWFSPGEPISVQLTAPPGGQAFAMLCTSSWRYEMFGAPNSPYYYATLYAPRSERVDNCPITAMYVAWNGNVTYANYPVFVHFEGPPAPQQQPTPTPSPAPTPAPTPTPQARTTIPDRRVPEPTATPERRYTEPRERVSPPPTTAR